ncbi:MAG: hypothetical protein Q9169_006111 [Polycauliona sp. 2 TL-2023]
MEHLSDQSAIPNLNANWVNAKGAWVIHIVLIVALKVFYSIIPGIQHDTSWFLTNITYLFGSYLMFHWVRGIPFEFNAGAYDNLNMWEQMDNGEQFTPTKKYLLSVPICLFLVSTHYTHYDLTYFTLNVMALFGVIIPKLPWVELNVLIRYDYCFGWEEYGKAIYLSYLQQIWPHSERMQLSVDITDI